MSKPMDDREHHEEHAAEEALRQVVREARADLRPPKYGPAFDWEKTERELLARVEAERNVVVAHERFGGSRVAWGAMTGLVAAAAAVMLFVGGPHGARQASYDTLGGVSAEAAPAGTLTARLEGAHVAIQGSNGTAEVTRGAAVRLGDVVEARGGRALFVSEGRVSWLLEADSRVRVRSVAPVVLGLERGAVEAQVAPVAQGEAFAVDVEGVRVAVHGTHLRVSREGELVSVDLSEGVVSVGEPPRVGSTYGTLAMAPARVIFSAADVAGTLHTVHGMDKLRAPVALDTLAEAPPSIAEAVASPPPATGPLATLPHATPSPAASHVATGSQGASAPAMTGPDPHADDTVSAAVRACSADGPHSSDVTVTVTTTLELRVGDDGYVTSARFNPPLPPEIQTCAGAAIFHTRFAEAGARKIPLVLQR